MTRRKSRARSGRPALVVTAAVSVALALSGCSGSHPTAPPSTVTTTTAASTTTSASPTPAPTTTTTQKPKPAPTNPFTGIGPVPKTPTIIVKIDDTAPGRPQVGIDRADIVYIEEAEGGLSRLAAVFGTYKPVAGYVRSTRPSDPDLFLQYGKITEAASGGGGDSLPRLRRSGIHGWINDGAAPYYSRVDRTESTYINLVLNLRAVADHVHTPAPKDVGLRFSRKPVVPGSLGTDAKTIVGGTPVEFRWWPKLHRYVRFIGGVPQRAADRHLVTAANVVAQVCKIVPHPQDKDVLGNPSQFTYTVGRGPVTVFRDGRMLTGRWHRKSTADGTHFSLVNGKTITLSPGSTWIALVRHSAYITGH